MDDRLSRIESHLDRLDGRFEQFEKRVVEGLAAVNTRVNDLQISLNSRIDDLGKRVSDLQSTMGLGLTVGFGWLTAVMVASVGILLKYR